VLSVNEIDILINCTRWMIRVQEQAIITVLKPTVNRDNVKVPNSMDSVRMWPNHLKLTS